MNIRPIMHGPLPRRGFLALTLAGLAGCASKPIVLDRAAMSDVKRIGVPTPGFPRSVDIVVTNATSRYFGSIGQITGSIIRGNRSDAVTAMMASRGMDPRATFQTALADRLATRKLAVVPEQASATRNGFLPTYAGGDGRDAILDTVVPQYGFLALDDSDSSPFRPTVLVRTRLTSSLSDLTRRGCML